MIMGRLLLTLLLTVHITLSAQNSQLFFSDVLDTHLPAYLLQAEDAIRNLEQDKVKVLFDNLVEDKITGSLMDNFTVTKLSKKAVALNDYTKPVMLLTYSSWRINCKGEQTALNELAAQYGDDVSIILLHWGTNKEVKKLAKGYHRNIDVLYVDDSDNKYTQIIKNLKHSLGLPLAYTITSDKTIINIKRRLSNKMAKDEKDAALENYDLYKNLLTELLFKQETLSEAPIVINK